jgi:hypothetical protein
MSRWRLDQERIISDGRLVLVVQRLRVTQALSRQLVELAREADQPLPGKGATAAGDVSKLRGIPAIGRGVPGAIRGSRPDVTTIAVGLHYDARSVYQLGVLAGDIDGTSPGTQPEEALMAKEDAA